MTIEYQIIGTLSHKYSVDVTFPVEHLYSVTMENVSRHKITHPDAEARFQALVDNYENGVKTEWPEWLVQDETRDDSFSVSSGPRVDPFDEDQEYYALAAQWSISATAKITIQVDTALDPETIDGAAAVQAAADQAVTDWLAERPLTPL